MRAKDRLGRWGENVIASWFQWQGYQITARNYRTPFGEIDLWVSSGSRAYLVEVKTRSRAPESLTVSGLTQQKLRRLARIHAYIQSERASSPSLQLYWAFALLIPSGIYWIPDVFDIHPLFASFPRRHSF